jgi:hypothetical protein
LKMCVSLHNRTKRQKNMHGNCGYNMHTCSVPQESMNMTEVLPVGLEKTLKVTEEIPTIIPRISSRPKGGYGR